MSKKQNRLLHLCLFTIGGLCYNLIELLWRGRTHPSMFAVGGVCFEWIGVVHTRSRRSFPARCGLCAVGITVIELVSGCILNRWLKLNVWDYSKMRCNILGQVCLLYSAFWLVLSAVAFPLYVGCRRRICRWLFASRGTKVP